MYDISGACPKPHLSRVQSRWVMWKCWEGMSVCACMEGLENEEAEVCECRTVPHCWLRVTHLLLGPLHIFLQSSLSSPGHPKLPLGSCTRNVKMSIKENFFFKAWKKI